MSGLNILSVVGLVIFLISWGIARGDPADQVIKGLVHRMKKKNSEIRGVLAHFSNYVQKIGEFSKKSTNF